MERRLDEPRSCLFVGVAPAPSHGWQIWSDWRRSPSCACKRVLGHYQTHASRVLHQCPFPWWCILDWLLLRMLWWLMYWIMMIPSTKNEHSRYMISKDHGERLIPLRMLLYSHVVSLWCKGGKTSWPCFLVIWSLACWLEAGHWWLDDSWLRCMQWRLTAGTSRRKRTAARSSTVVTDSRRAGGFPWSILRPWKLPNLY